MEHLHSYPEFDAAELNADLVRSTLEKHNCLLIRRLAPPALMSRLLQRVLQVFELRQQGVDQLAGPEVSQQDRKNNTVISLTLPDLDIPEAPPHQVLALFRASILNPLLHALLGTPVYFNTTESYVRKVMPDRPDTFLPYHQDSQYLVHHHLPYLNCWIPLVPCGQAAPSLEVLPSDLKQMLLLNTGFVSLPMKMEMQLAPDVEPHPDAFFEASGYAEKYADRLWQPLFDPGDIMLLNEYAVHRTFARPTMTQIRYSMEMRFLSGHLIRPELIRHYGLVRL